MPPRIQQSLKFKYSLRCVKIEYNLKAQLLPTTPEFIVNFEKGEPGVGNLDYESCVSDKVPVLISPDRAVVVNPLTCVPVEWSKSVGYP